jgi:hypothetical protein
MKAAKKRIPNLKLKSSSGGGVKARRIGALRNKKG